MDCYPSHKLKSITYISENVIEILRLFHLHCCNRNQTIFQTIKHNHTLSFTTTIPIFIHAIHLRKKRNKKRSA